MGEPDSSEPNSLQMLHPYPLARQAPILLGWKTVKEIPLTKGKVALVDDADYDFLSQWKWYAWKAPHSRNWYAKRGESIGWIKGKRKIRQIWMHRVLLGLIDPTIEGDHADGDGLNNQRQNLRASSHQQNCSNRKLRLDTTSQFRGVNKNHRTGRWQSRIGLKDKRIALGAFDTPEEAARAYDDAAIKHFGEFGSLNFPQGKAA